MRKICLRCGAKFGSRAEYCPHDGSLLATDDQIADPLLGTVLLEQFRIEEQIGVGGMGTVYRAHQPSIGRDVAIKVLRAELARDLQAVARFEREARLATSLDHPNLVRVFLSGQLSDGRLYIVMELLKGRSLADELEHEGVPSIERALIMIMKLCAGLSAVHSAGIVHRDIKPENVYLVQRGRDRDFVKLVDFGVARVLEADGVGPTTTQSGRVFGTATYISPEAATGDDTDQRSDIYSLGVLSYQLLTGELPFRGSTAGAILMQHVHNDPPPLRTKGRGSEVPIEVADVIMRSLSKDPDARPQTLAEFLDSLAEAAGRAGLLQDARTLLLGTIWGDELAAPGSYLAELLGASSAPASVPPGLEQTQPVPVKRDPEEEALLSSAPKPFGTTSHDLAPAPRRKKKRRYGLLWAMLGVLAVVLVGVVAGSWLKEPTPAVAPTDEENAPLADVGTNVPVPDAVPDEAPIEDVAPVEKPQPEEQVSEPESPPQLTSQPQPRKRRKPKVSARRPPTVPASAPEKASALEPDEGIDWSLPDFPDEPPAAESPPASADPPASSNPSAPAGPTKPVEPPAPTGTPDAPARNPVVIDEPPR